MSDDSTSDLQRSSSEEAPTTKLDLDLLAKTCYSAVFSDACDRIGLRHQTLDPGIEPQTATDKVIVGWARIVRWRAVDFIPDPPYAAEIEFLNSLRAGEVVIGTAGGAPVALWGELFSAAALGRGARGAVLDGLTRDRRRIQALGFPVHALGTHPTDTLGRVSLENPDGPVTVRGVKVSNGDLIISDADGVVVVPREVAPDIAAAALEKATTERKGLVMLKEGSLISEVWNQYQVL